MCVCVCVCFEHRNIILNGMTIEQLKVIKGTIKLHRLPLRESLPNLIFFSNLLSLAQGQKYATARIMLPGEAL